MNSDLLETKVTPMRWVVLLAYCCLNLSNAMMWVTFAPISKLTEEYYNCSSFFVNLQSLVYMFLFLFVNFLACYSLTHYGIRNSLLFGAVLQCVGAWLRYFSPATGWLRFVMITGGQSLGALVQPWIINAPAQLAGMWFSDDERVTATALGFVSNSLGVALGFFIPTLITNHQASNVPKLLMVEAAILTGSMLFSLVIPKKPVHPPSMSAYHTYFKERCSDGKDPEDTIQVEDSALLKGEPGAMGGENTPLKEQFRQMMQSRHFVWLSVLLAVVLGVFNVLATLLPQILSPYGLGDQEASIVCVIFILMGVVGSGVFGAVVDKTGNHKLMILISQVGAGALLAIFGLILHQRWVGSTLPIWSLYVLIGINGFIFTPLLPIGFDLSVELTYPVVESSSQGFSVWLGQVAGIIGVFGLQGITANGHGAITVFICSASLILSLPVVPMFWKGRSQRPEAADPPSGEVNGVEWQKCTPASVD